MNQQNQQTTEIQNATPINNLVLPNDSKRKIPLPTSYLIILVLFLIFLVGSSAYILGQKSASTRFNEIIPTPVNNISEKLPTEKPDLLPTETQTIITPTKNPIPTLNMKSDWQTLESQSGYYPESNEGLFTISYPTDICSVLSQTPKNPNIEFNKLTDQYIQCNKDEYSFKIYPFAAGAGVGQTVEKNNITLGQYSWRRVLFKGPYTGNDYGVFYDTNIDGLTYYIQIEFGEKYSSDLLGITDSIIATFKPV